MGNSQLHRIHYIDGLRAFAVCLVLFHHSLGGVIAGILAKAEAPEKLISLARYITGSGVELFFCISGIVLLKPYLQGQKKFSYISYFLRRFERIYPAYWGALLLGGLVILFVSTFPTWYSREILPKFNFFDWMSQVSLLPFSTATYNAAWWSLSIELMFYLIGTVNRYFS